ncbi:hypothetical protein BJ684DRAFT_5987, partial [Piptocephalis cylindrospora]
TKIHKDAGRSPSWSETLRFRVKDPPPSSSPAAASAFAPTLRVRALTEGLADNRVIGEASMDLRKVLLDQSSDSWIELKESGKYAGDIYLELTY